MITLLLAIPASAAQGEGYLFGLGLHEETGRDIYLGGIYLADGAVRPEQLLRMPDPWVMEYRIVARRTSIRSLLGGILLQSEVATGRSPGPATTAFADNILSSVKSSLYAGDALEIQLENNITYATLNGQRLALSSNPEVAAYFLSGWVSENGPNSAFRTDLIANKVNPDLLDQYNATQYSAERQAEVAAWLGGPAPKAAAPPPPVREALVQEQPTVTGESQLPAPQAPPSATQSTERFPAQASMATTTITTATTTGAATTNTADEAAAAIGAATSTTSPNIASAVTASGTSAADIAAAGAIDAVSIATAALERNGADPDSIPRATLAQSGDAAARATPNEIAQGPVNSATLAALIRDAELSGSAPNTMQDRLPETAPDTTEQAAKIETGVLALGVQEYSQRLASFHNQVIAKVYSEIRYPKRAVRRNLQGRLELDVSMSRDGRLLGVEVALSSGHKILDNAAIAAAKNAFESKLDNLDEVAIEEFGTRDGSLIVPIPVQFRLQ